MAHVTLLIVLIVGTGLLGGLSNYLLDRAEGDYSWRWFGVFRSLALGLTAAAVVPLFLSMLSSNLMHDCAEKPLLYFVFAGFCLIAAAFSPRFLSSVGDRVLRELDAIKKENADLQETTEMIVMQNSDDRDESLDAFRSAPNAATAPPADDSDVFESTGGRSTSQSPPSDRERLIQVFAQRGFAFRTLKKLTEQSGLSEQTVKRLLEELEAEGRIKSVVRRSDGVTCWMAL